MGSRLAALMLALALGGTDAAAGLACREDTVWLRGDFGTARFGVTVADDAAERAQGLMFVESMPASRGMLFVYPEAREGVAFWMKNTLIPLDILFADASGTIVDIAADAVPGDETPLPAEGAVQYVLEINGGLAARMGIGPGAQMRHPAIAGGAWPCD